MAPMLLAFAVMLAIGVPIAFAMGLAGSISLLEMHARPALIPARMFNGIDSFVLLAAPFYILAGEIMGRAGITERLIRLSLLIAGRVRGGSAYASVIASVLFSGISGTAVGDAAALGQIFIRELPKEGYRTEYAAALVVAGSMIGPIVPPSVTLVILGAVSQISVVRLFVAGIVPGFVVAAAIALVIFWHSRTRNLPRTRITVTRAEIWPTIRDGAFVMFMPVILLGGALSGIFTPTEAGGVAVLYAIFVGVVVLRTLSAGALWRALIVAAKITASIYLVLATAEILSYAMAVGGVTGWVRAMASAYHGSHSVFLLMLVAFLIVIGTFLEPGPAIVIFVPIFLPIATALGIDPLQFSLVLVLTLTLGLSTPPIGLCLFIACKIGGIGIWSLFRELWPFFLTEKAVVILLCLAPPLTTWLPSLLH